MASDAHAHLGEKGGDLSSSASRGFKQFLKSLLSLISYYFCLRVSTCNMSVIVLSTSDNRTIKRQGAKTVLERSLFFRRDLSSLDHGVLFLFVCAGKRDRLCMRRRPNQGLTTSTGLFTTRRTASTATRMMARASTSSDSMLGANRSYSIGLRLQVQTFKGCHTLQGEFMPLLSSAIYCMHVIARLQRGYFLRLKEEQKGSAGAGKEMLSENCRVSRG